ncbi:MAG: type II secretion system protein [Phycisphaerales bacterium]
MKNTDDTSLTLSTRPFKSSAGFSLIELLVTLSIIALLSGIMMPTLKGVRASAEKLMCANNMRSIYYGFNGYANDQSRPFMPTSIPYETKQFKDTMAITAKESLNDPQEWDGLGLLLKGAYLDNSKCLYCASHHGDHSFETYQADLENISTHPVSPDRQLFCNYQYAGGYENVYKNNKLNRSPKKIYFNDIANNVLLTDGMRSANDFNHGKGSNSLSSGGEIRWFNNNEKILSPKLNARITGELPNESFPSIWASIQREIDR